MKLPRMLLADDPRRALGVRPANAIDETTYALWVCTTNLGATASAAGDPTLPHCLVDVRDGAGRRVRAVSLSRRGVGPEPMPDVPSRRCESPPVPVTEVELRRFDAALRRCADAGYAWGERDCCSCIERAFAEGLERAAPAALSRAAATLAAVPDPWLRRAR
ncbi:MAG: hypothetical protein AB1Z98_09245 [Nannocystaceae bacterium]